MCGVRIVVIIDPECRLAPYRIKLQNILHRIALPTLAEKNQPVVLYTIGIGGGNMQIDRRTLSDSIYLYRHHFQFAMEGALPVYRQILQVNIGTAADPERNDTAMKDKFRSLPVYL